MYIDKELQFSSAQAVTTSAASANVIDLGVNRDVGVSGGLQIHVKVDQAVAAAGAATVQVQLQTATDAAFTTPITVAMSDAVPKASLVAGYQFYMPLPIGLNKRYVRLNYVVGTGPLSAGSFSAAVVKGPQVFIAYPAPSQV